MPRTEAFLAHNAIPVQFTEEDFDQVLSGNFVTKVIYLPDPEFQELALAGVETLVSTRLDPGVDPVVEADRRGAILAIVRLGNKDLQAPGGQAPEGGVTARRYQSLGNHGRAAAGAPLPMGTPVGGYSTMPMNYMSGVTGPQYGMPMCGTPIGLPGPPSVPLGVPAGLQKHVIVNHTAVHLPEPTKKVRVDVKEEPGYSYPKPADHVRIVERTSPGEGFTGNLWPTATSASAGVRRSVRRRRLARWSHNRQALRASRGNDSQFPPPTTRDNGPIDPLSGNRSEGLRRRVAGRMVMLVLWCLGPATRAARPSSRRCTISIKALCHRERLAAGNSSGADHCPGSFSQLRSRPRRGP